MLVLPVSGNEAARQLESLLARIAHGETEAVGPLYDRTRAAVYSFALSIVKKPQDAEDVLQDVYLRICAAADQYRPKGAPMAWILAITRSTALMALRGSRRTEPVSDEELERLCRRDAVTPEDRIVLIAALKTLSSEELQIVILHAMNGLKHREIAALLHLPLATVLSKYRRALKKLKEQLKEGYEA